ncbi:hypothetical protein TrST_g7379 [Triparma strigata]|uniref:Uncharacterized protein n=1 Tax=Triparma strigata TaxID=1606541 RepID=A0A9W7BVR1_9STRA|nr:hypothetical protein TrST_g7379 [Triparma strigata]
MDKTLASPGHPDVVVLPEPLHARAQHDELSPPTASLSQVRALQAELRATVAQLQEERTAREEERVAKVEAVEKLKTVVSQINKDETLREVRRNLDSSATATNRPLDRTTPGVEAGSYHMLILDTITKTITLNIHEEPREVLSSLMGGKADQLQQTVLKDSPSTSETIVYWSLVEQKKDFNLLLRLRVERQDDVEIDLSVASLDEEELNSSCLPIPPSNFAFARSFRLRLQDGQIILRPLPQGQTSLTFVARIDLHEVSQLDAGESAPSHVASTIMGAIRSGINQRMSSRSAMKRISSKLSTGAQFMRGTGVKADGVFYKIAGQFYLRYQKEAVIDARRKRDFIDGIRNVPPLTEGERNLITNLVTLAKDAARRAKRIAGTVNDPVEKFLYRDGQDGAAWGMSVAKIDVSASTFFAELWLLDTYAKKVESKESIREVWNELDGTRGLQFSKSVKFPGFQER